MNRSSIRVVWAIARPILLASLLTGCGKQAKHPAPPREAAKVSGSVSIAADGGSDAQQKRRCAFPFNLSRLDDFFARGRTLNPTRLDTKAPASGSIDLALRSIFSGATSMARPGDDGYERGRSLLGAAQNAREIAKRIEIENDVTDLQKQRAVHEDLKNESEVLKLDGEIRSRRNRIDAARTASANAEARYNSFITEILTDDFRVELAKEICRILINEGYVEQAKIVSTLLPEDYPGTERITFELSRKVCSAQAIEAKTLSEGALPEIRPRLERTTSPKLPFSDFEYAFYFSTQALDGHFVRVLSDEEIDRLTWTLRDRDHLYQAMEAKRKNLYERPKLLNNLFRAIEDGLGNGHFVEAQKAALRIWLDMLNEKPATDPESLYARLNVSRLP